PFMRPPELAADSTPTEPVLVHALDQLRADGYVPDAVVLLQPTSPIRHPGAVDEAIQQFEDESADSLLSVTESSPFLWRNIGGQVVPLYDFERRPRRQDIAPSDRL